VTFAEIQFEHQTPEYPWADARMERLAFKDCAVRAALSGLGCHREHDAQVPATVPVTAFYETQGGLMDAHARAFDFFAQNVARYEARALACLYEVGKEVVKEGLSFHGSPGYERFTRGLPEFIAKYRLDTHDGIVNQVSWASLSLYECGLDDRGLISLDFHCGWDEEHGISLLMHDARLVAVSCLSDFSNQGGGLLAQARYIQKRCGSAYDIALL